MERADEKKPTGVGGFSTGGEVRVVEGWEPVETWKPEPEINDAAREALEKVAAQMSKWSQSAFQTAKKQPADDDFGRRFIEHGGTCYFNCWSLLRQCLDAASPPSSTTPEER
jgi:hypothetical protein